MLAIAGVTSNAPADEKGVAARDIDSSRQGEQRLRAELRALLMDMVQSGGLQTNSGEPVSLQIDSIGERASDLGVLVDTRSGAAAKRGLLVLGTTPGSLASKIGFRRGDVIVSLNGIGLVELGSDSDGSALAGSVLRETLVGVEDGAPLSFVTLRDGTSLTLAGTKQSVWIPPFSLRVGGADPDSGLTTIPRSGERGSTGSHCGWISTFDNAPRQKHLHGAVLISIDGEHTPLLGRSNYRVSVGQHVLKVGELIDDRYLAFSPSFRDRGVSDRYKMLTVEVAENTVYSLAARLNEDQRNEWREGRFWDPVIWSSKQESCR